jgi:adenosylcobinamide-GDP ribazoletransferase
MQFVSLAWGRRKDFWLNLHQTEYLPLLSILTGAIAGGTFLSSYALFENKNLAILFGILASIIATKAANENSLSRYFEMFVGGTSGTIALVISLLIKYQGLLLIPVRLVPSVFIAGLAFSKYASSSFVFTHSRISQHGREVVKTRPQQPMNTRGFIIMTFLGMVPLLAIGSLLLLLLIPLLWFFRNIFGMWFIRKLGGFTDDCLGATGQMIEVFFYMLVVIACLYPLRIG